MELFRKGSMRGLNMIRFDRFKDGKKHCLTFSYDDGEVHDKRLIEILNKYGMKGTFHLNSGHFDLDNYIKEEDVRKVYAGHEVSCHSVTHPFPDRIPRAEWMREVFEDRKKLESLCG